MSVLLQLVGCAFLFPISTDEGESCSPDCDGRECGPDGCGGSCGECDSGNACLAGVCVPCEEACEDDVRKCGGLPNTPCDCGTCPEGFTCLTPHEFRANDAFSAACRACAEICSGHTCGSAHDCDCGACPFGETCAWPDSSHAGNHCVCAPTCSNEAGDVEFLCGSDGCGGECGACEYGACVDHVCFCEPQCADKPCGPDACGGFCPNGCDQEELCFEAQCAAPCDLSSFAFSPYASKAVKLMFGKGGLLGEALDVDGDPDTCSPEGNCYYGLDNEASQIVEQVGLFWSADAETAKWLEGDLILLKELVEPKFDGQPFILRVYHGQKAFEPGSCNHQQEVCPYFASIDSFNPFTCQPYNVFDNATINDGRLSAGGKGYSINIVFVSEHGEAFEATLHQVRVEADIVLDADGLRLVNGISAGALRKAAVLDALNHIPPDEREDLPVSVDVLKNLLNMFLQPDIDLDGDGELDAISYGVKFETIPASIVGTSPERVWGIGFGF